MSNWNVLCLSVFLIPLSCFYTRLSEYFIQDGEPWILTRDAHEPLERRQDGSRYVIPSYSSNYVLFLAMISHVWCHEVRRRVHTTWVCIDSEDAHCKVVYNSDYTCFSYSIPSQQCTVRIPGRSTSHPITSRSRSHTLYYITSRLNTIHCTTGTLNTIDTTTNRLNTVNSTTNRLNIIH